MASLIRRNVRALNNGLSAAMPVGAPGRLRPCLASMLAFGIVALVTLGIGSSTEQMMRTGFASAIAQTGPTGDTLASAPASHRKGHEAVTVASRGPAMPVSGSEDYWLSAQKTDSNIRLTRTTPSVGDYVSLRLNGRNVSLEITAIAPLDPAVTRIDVRQSPDRPLLITARDGRKRDARPVSFVVKLNALQPVYGKTGERAL